MFKRIEVESIVLRLIVVGVGITVAPSAIVTIWPGFKTAFSFDFAAIEAITLPSSPITLTCPPTFDIWSVPPFIATMTDGVRTTSSFDPLGALSIKVPPSSAKSPGPGPKRKVAFDRTPVWLAPCRQFQPDGPAIEGRVFESPCH